MIKGLLKSKTAWFGFAVAALGFLETFDVTSIAAFIPDDVEPLLASFVGFVIVALRFVTTKPLDQK